MRAETLIQRFGTLSPTAQVIVPGLYAWMVTVGPVLLDLRWERAPGAGGAHGTSLVAILAALLGPLCLLSGPVVERRWAQRGRVLALWGFVLSCALAWSVAPWVVSPQRVDVLRGMAGMIGWSLFALASAAPALHRVNDDERVTPPEQRPVKRRRLTRSDAGYLLGGALVAALLQWLGWRVAGAERALLLRLVSLAAGIAIIGAATELALARHARRVPRSRARRLRSAMAALVLLAILGLTGVIFGLR